MTQAELLAKIKAEIERRKSGLKRYYNDDLIKCRAYDEMLSILSTFEKSEKPIPKDLEEAADFAYRIECEAAEKRYEEEYSTGEYCHEQSFKWGFQEGVDWHKEQMMKEAVEATVMATRCGDKYQQLLITDWNGSDGLHNGDKVRVIVLKRRTKNEDLS